jgi:drug/metabolite transporter (DMT)-like permease
MQHQTEKSSGINPGYFALFITSTFWGTTWVVSKFAIQHVPALQMSSIRQAIAGSAFLIFFLLVKKQPIPQLKDLKWLFLMSVLMMFLANGLSTWGLKFVPTGLGSLIGALYPMSVWLIERIFYKKKTGNALTIIGLIVGLVGVGFVFYHNIYATITGDLIFGLILSLLAMTSWSWGTILLSKSRLSINPYHGMGWQMMMGSIMLFLFSEFTGECIPLKEINAEGWASILYLSVFGSIITFIAFIYSLKKLPATISSLYAYFNPIVAMWIGSLWLGEKLTKEILIGAVFTLVGVYLVNHSIKRDQEKIIAESEV